MIDTGAAPNLIKKRNLHPGTRIRADQTVFLRGITDGSIETLGSIDIVFMGHPVTLQVVGNDFPITQEGILGSDFLRDASRIDFAKRIVYWQDVTIPFSTCHTVTIPPRSRTTIPIRVNNALTEGYVPRLYPCDDVYLGDAVVTNRGGKAYLHAYNTGSKDAKFPILSVDLEEVDKIATAQDRFADSALGLEAGTRSSDGASSESLSHAIHSITNSVENRAQDVRELLRLEHLNDEESGHVQRLIAKYVDVFHLPSDRLGCTNALRHTINTTDEQPIHTKQYRFPPIHKEEIDKQIKQLLDNDVIKPSISPYNSPLWIVPKKADSKGNKRWRMVIDYRALNEKTIGDAYPLPNITEILDQLGSAKYFSVFDLASGFHQIPMDGKDAPKTAFSTPYGHYEFKRMPFGLRNAPATFQRLMDHVLTGLQGIELFVYLDDIVLYASSLREHEIKFEKLAARLREANLKLQPDKCEFLRREVGYLGHIIGEDGVKPDPKKVEAVKRFPRPTNAKTIKQFLGLAGYYRRFIPNFSRIAKPLTNLLKKETAFVWNNEQAEAFAHLRDALCSQPLLQYPDFTKPFIVTTDASNNAIGGILSQGTVGKDLPISYVSRLLNKAEQNYSTIERELLAIVYCVNHFRPYLFGRKFQLVTDHKPLVWLNSVKDPTSRLVRWRLKIAEYDYEVIYKAGKINANADALSRNPIPEQILPLSHSLPGVSRQDGHALPPEFDTVPKPGGKIKNIIYMPVPPDDQNTCELAISNISSEEETVALTDGDTDSDADGPMVDPANEHRPNRARIVETRDNINSRNDNLVVFVTSRGEPCDEGARILQESNRLPEIKDATIGRAKVIKNGKTYLIALILEGRISIPLQLETLKETVASLYDVTTELQLKTISISKGSVIDIPWDVTRNLIFRGFSDSPTKIIICSNQITTPPEAERHEIIRENHATAIGGHKGVTKTTNRIKYKYQWPRLKEDVQTYIRNCRECQLKKLVRLKTRQPMTLTDTPGAAFDKVSMDIMGPLPTSINGNSYILTIQDLLTKYSLAIPLKQTTAVHTADAFVNRFICTFGSPRAIVTDQGRNFISSLMRNVARKFKIKQCRTTAYRPQSNGSVERSHQVLWDYLKQFVEKNDWDEYLDLASFSYNTSVHEGTQFTPYELVFGKVAETPISDFSLNAETNETYYLYLTALFDRLKETQRIARENLCQAKIRSKRYYDRKARPFNFNIGDPVYMLREPIRNKLANQYLGPYIISEILGNGNVRLELSGGRTRVVHTDKLKIAQPRDPTLVTTPTAPPRD